MPTHSAQKRIRAREGLPGWLRVAAPLGVALVLITVSVLLLLAPSSDDGASVDARNAQAPQSDIVRSEVPVADPSHPDPYTVQEALPRYAGKYGRWNLSEFPEGWDDAIAATIHTFFEEMEFDPRDSKKMLRVEKLREEFQQYLATLGPEAIPTLKAILNVEPDFVDRRFLIYKFGELGVQSEEATYVLSDYLLNRSDRPQSRSELLHVITAMGKLKNDSAYDTLSEFVALPDLHSYRAKLVRSLGDHPYRDDAVGTFVDLMRNDPLPDVRNNAAQALGKVRSSETLHELYSSFKREPHWVAKQTILGSIGKISNPNSIPFLEDQARNAKESAVRLSAAGALRRMDSTYARRLLRELGRTEPDLNVRKHINKWAEAPVPASR